MSERSKIQSTVGDAPVANAEKPDLSYPAFWREPSGSFGASNGELYATTSAAAVLAGGLFGYGSTDDKDKVKRNVAIGSVVGLTGVLTLMAVNYMGWRKKTQATTAPRPIEVAHAIAARDLPPGYRLVAEIAPARSLQGSEFEAKQVELKSGQCYAVVAVASDPSVSFEVFLRSIGDKSRVLHETSHDWLSVHRITCSESGPFMFGIHNIGAADSTSQFVAQLYEVSP
jgi:hypothetical protein